MTTSYKNEIWKSITIEEYGEFYEISNMGRVKRIKSRFGNPIERILNPYDRGGYCRIDLNINNKRHTMSVHRLVLLAFVGNPTFEQNEVNHKNGIKTNNRLDNLEWVTSKENQIHSFNVLGRLPNYGEKNGMSKLTKENVMEIRKLLNENNLTQREIGIKFGILQTTVSEIKYKHLWKHV